LHSPGRPKHGFRYAEAGAPAIGRGERRAYRKMATERTRIYTVSGRGGAALRSVADVVGLNAQSHSPIPSYPPSPPNTYHRREPQL